MMIFAKKYAQALCAKNFQCCDASELEGKTMSSCVMDNQTVIGLLVSGGQLLAGAGAGELRRQE